jgi:hypothetical protein
MAPAQRHRSDSAELIDQMIEAVSAERAAVRMALGALGAQGAVDVRDGLRLVAEPGALVYRFDCDLELLIADGTRIQVQAPGTSSAGEVVDHDPALGHIGFLLREDLGEFVPEAKLDFDSTYLLDLLTTQLESIKASMGPGGPGAPSDSPGARHVDRALAFLEGTVAPREPVPLERTGLSESQNRAVSFVVGQGAAYLWGPPGTGKTQTVAHLVHALIERGEKVLLTAHTNVAADTALLRVLREKRLPPLAVVRVGYYGEELRPFGVGLDEQGDGLLRARHPDQAKQMERLCERVARHASSPPGLLTSVKAALPRRFRVALELLPSLSLSEDREMTEEAAELQELLGRVEREIVDSARLVSSTLTRLYTSRLLRTYEADSVVIDEASIASLVLAFVAACCARKRAIAAGDFMQLPAIVLAEEPAARRWLGRHVFASASCDRADREHPLRAMLDEQWRMHPQIARVVSNVFYAGKLKNAPAVLERARARARAHQGPALLILDTSRLPAVSETVASGSKLNRVHAELIARLVALSRKQGVAIIAPYRAQVRHIRKAIRGIAGKRLESGEVEVFTVHRFQGRDKELVVFDLVEAPGTKGRFIHELHNPDAPNLINVAMSRAQERLVVVAHLRHLSETLGQKTTINRVFAQIRAAGGLEIVAGDERDEALLERFLEGEGHGDPRH